MAKARGVEAKLLRLHFSQPTAGSFGDRRLRHGLGDTSNLVVAEAAAVIGDNTVRELAQDLVAAFEP